MRLARYRPMLTDRIMLPSLGETPTRLNRMLEDLLTPMMPSETIAWMPVIDIVDRDDELLLTAELPGLKKGDVQMEIADGVFTLKGEKKEEKRDETPRYQVWERSFGSFERSFTLPRAVDVAKIKATFEDGVLTVHMPKTEQSHGRRIEIAG